MRKSFLLAAAVLSAAMIASCGMLGGKKVYQSDGELRREYKASKDAFKNKYEGKEVVFWGKTDTVNLTGPLGIVRFTSDSDLVDTPSIFCEVAPADIKRFQDLHVKEGDFVRVKGTMKTSDSTLDVKNCQLVTFGLSSMSDD